MNEDTNLNCRKCNSKHKQNNDKCQYDCKKPTKLCICKEDYVWNPSICACDCGKIVRLAKA